MRPTHQFDKIAILTPSEYPAGFLSPDHKPGTVFLLDSVGLHGGVMKVTNTGYFMTLTQAEIFGERPFQWPESDKLVVIRRGTLRPHSP